MRGRTGPAPNTLARAFAQDLRGEYVPDALGAADVRRDVAAGGPVADTPITADQLTVPGLGAGREVPVVPSAVRARLHVLTERALAGRRPRPEVFGHRSATGTFRAAHRAWRDRVRLLAALPHEPLLLALDVRGFGARLPLRALLDAPWMTAELACCLTELRGVAGRCLPPGNRWANRLGTAALAPVDDVVAALTPERWARWGDEWLIPVADADRAAEITDAVAEALRRLGLELSPGKTVLRPSAAMVAGPGRDVAGDPREVWRRGLLDGDERRLRYALPRLGPAPYVCAELPGVVAQCPRLLPRAVEFLDRAAATPHGCAAVAALLQTHRGDLFGTARLLALAGRYRAVASLVDDTLLGSAATAPVTAVRELAARAAWLTGRGGRFPHPSPRLRAWAARGAREHDSRPVVRTVL